MSDTLSFSTPERVGIIQRISVRFGGSKSRELERFLKFAVVGTIGAVIDLGLTNVFLRFVFHVQPGDVLPAVISSAVGFTAAAKRTRTALVPGLAGGGSAVALVLTAS